MPPEMGSLDFLIPVAGMLTGVIITGMVVLGPVGRGIGDVLRHWLGGGRMERELLGELDDVRERFQAVQRQLADLAERQDFTERMLAQGRRERALPGGGGDGE